jgi:hypothetical protein
MGLIIVTPAVSYRLTSEARARDRLQLSAESVPSPRLLDMIDQASIAVITHCQRGFARETVTETLRTNGAGVLVLAKTPVASIAALAVDGAALSSGSWAVNSGSGLLERTSGGQPIGWGGRVVSVTYTAGWIVPEDPAYGVTPLLERLPTDVEGACLAMVAAQHASTGRDPMLRSESTEGVGSASYVAVVGMGALPPQAEASLSRYCRSVIA